MSVLALKTAWGLYTIALGPDLDTHLNAPHIAVGGSVTRSWPGRLVNNSVDNTRIGPRHAVSLPARLTWKDQRGTTRFASVVARNVSEHGVYVECQSPVSIPLFRLVQLQLEREVRQGEALPEALQRGRVLSAVYRVSPPSSSQPQGLALRMMVDPRRSSAIEQTRATA
jgi:hypothetical protein